MKELMIKGYEFKDLDEHAIINVCINLDINTPEEVEECGYTTFKDMDIKYYHVCGRSEYTFDTECIELDGECIISKHKCDDPGSKTKCKDITVRESHYSIYQHDPSDLQEFCDMNNYLFDVKGNLINHLKELEVSNE